MKEKLKKLLACVLTVCMVITVFAPMQTLAKAKENGSKEHPYSAYKPRTVDVYGARYYGRARIKLTDYKDGKKAYKYLKKNGVKKKAGNPKEYVYLKFKIDYIEGKELLPADIILSPYSSYFDSECEERLETKKVKCNDGVEDLTNVTMFPGESVICKQILLVDSGDTPVTYSIYGYDKNGKPMETWFKTKK